MASYRFERPVIELYRATLPFIAILLLTLVIITYLPWLSLALVRLLG
jgi:TRAP-type C4-dicarboxylate transport system permease large subunit